MCWPTLRIRRSQLWRACSWCSWWCMRCLACAALFSIWSLPRRPCAGSTACWCCSGARPSRMGSGCCSCWPGGHRRVRDVRIDGARLPAGAAARTRFMMDASQSVPDDRSPLAIIRQKELEIADRLEAARQAAERRLLEARRAATETRDQAEREGRAAATALLQSELAAADADGENLRKQSEAIAARIAERGA